MKKNAKILKIENDIKKMKKELERMKKKGLSASVISAQEAEIEAKKQQLENLTRQEKARQGLFDKDKFLTFSVIDSESYETTEMQYKVAWVKNNRPINNNKVDGFIRIIANDKYEKNAPIFAITAIEAISNGYEVTDVKGNIILKENAEDYLVVLDGQHRTLAFLKSNMTELRVVPSTFIKTRIDIGQYLVDINDVGTSWSQRDRFAVAALVSEDELAHEISDRISEGFNPTTSSLIYTGKKISGKEVKKLLRGENWTLPEGAKLDINRGNKFILQCKEAGVSVKFITKRYFITGFNAYAEAHGDRAAFEQLGKLKGEKLTERRLRDIKDGTEFEQILREVS